jgi:RNA polymerase sigma-70 factor (ECF subfamily)
MRVAMSEFSQLLEREIPYLRRYARALVRNSAGADDLVQSCLVRALAKQHLWQPGTNLRSWLFTILHNQRISELRRSVREERALAGAQLPAAMPFGGDPTAWIRLFDVDRALAQLPEAQRTVVLLVGLEGMPYGEAAAVLDVPLGTVRSRLARARAALRRVMNEEAEEPLARACRPAAGEQPAAVWH